jgi:hypothetical protein
MREVCIKEVEIIIKTTNIALSKRKLQKPVSLHTIISQNKKP